MGKCCCLLNEPQTKSLLYAMLLFYQHKSCRILYFYLYLYDFFFRPIHTSQKAICTTIILSWNRSFPLDSFSFYNCWAKLKQHNCTLVIRDYWVGAATIAKNKINTNIVNWHICTIRNGIVDKTQEWMNALRKK